MCTIFHGLKEHEERKQFVKHERDSSEDENDLIFFASHLHRWRHFNFSCVVFLLFCVGIAMQDILCLRREEWLGKPNWT